MGLISNLSAELSALPPAMLKEITVVFPNRRAGLFLRRQLSIGAKGPMWLPEMLSVEEAFARWSGYGVADNLTLIVELISKQLSEGDKGGRDAAAFIGHARQMAVDFDEIDHYLADPQAVFTALSEAKAAETWHPDGSPLSRYETAYLSFFGALLNYYRWLKNRLLERGLMWPGAMAAHLASWSEQQWLEKLPDGEVWFAGFNALTPAEEKVMTTLCGMGKAKMFWDLDNYYMLPGSDGQHQAGSAMRRFQKNYPELVEHWIGNDLTTKPKKIRIVSTSGAVAQAKALGVMLLAQIPDGNNTDEAIVLADEKLLEPVLNSLPEEVGEVNVTMGYPLANSPLFHLAVKMAQLAVFRAHAERETLPLMLVTDLLMHPLVSGAIENELGKGCALLALKLITDGSANIFPHRLEEHLIHLPPSVQQLVNELFALQKKSAGELPAAMVQWLETPGLLNISDYLLEKQLDELRRLLNILSDALKVSGLSARESVPLLLKQLGKNSHIKLNGEPLKGLQVMGMLETRNLSFRQVHLLSANEGMLPAAKSSSSLIPADIRRHFGLPMRSDKDAISAFHFYQLVQHADEIVFYYNTEPDALGGGEMSRFLLQIRHQLIKVNKDISWEEITFNPPLPAGSGEVRIEIPKSEAIREALARKAESGISPSALSRWYNCSLQYYLGEILGIKEKNLPGDLPGYNVTGTIIHKAIELLYKPYVDKPLTEEAITNMLLQLDKAMDEAFSNELPGVSKTIGRNALQYAMARKMVERALGNDLKEVKKNSRISVLKQEEKLEAAIDTSSGTLRLKGFPDRIDTDGQGLRIIDFKTGSFDEKRLQINQIEELTNPEKKFALQLACYMLMAEKTFNNLTGLRPRGYILPLKQSNTGLVEATLPFDGSQGFSEFEALLTVTLEEMLDLAVPIAQTTEIKRCANCIFLRICNREAAAANNY